MKNILMVGLDLSVKGGMTTVQSMIMNHWKNNSSIKLDFIPTYIEKGILQKLIFFAIAIIKIFFTLILKKIDGVYIHVAYGGSFYRKSIVILLARLFNKNIYLHTHGSDFDTFYKNSSKRVQKYISWIFNLSTQTICLTKQWMDYYGNAVKVNNEKLCLLYNSVDAQEKNSYSLTNKDILFLGLLGERKGVYDLLEVVEDVVQKHPETKFILAGNGEVEKVKQIVNSKGVEKNVVVPGWIGPKEREELLQGAAVYILPSYHEGLPMSVLEALSFGIPVITTKIGGLPEVIQNGKDGILVQAGDIEAIKTNILRLLDNQELRTELSNNGYNKICSYFNSRNFLKNLENILTGKSCLAHNP